MSENSSVNLTEYKVKKTLQDLAKMLGKEVGVIAVELTVEQKIFFSYDLEETLGYEDYELEGESFSIVLPPGFDAEHRKKMATYFNETDTLKVRQMAQNRLGIQARKKDGTITNITVSISKYNLNHPCIPDLGIAFIQLSNQKKLIDSERLESVHNMVRGILLPGGTAVVQVKKFLLAKIAAGGGGFAGIFALILWILSTSTAFRTTWRSFVTAWFPSPVSPTSVLNQTEPVLDIPLTSAEQKENMILVLDQLKKLSKAPVAIAYYDYLRETDYSDPKLEFIRDTNTGETEETWFDDQVLSPEKIEQLGLKEIPQVTLRNHNCFLWRDIGRFVNRPNRDPFSAIVCPTFSISQDPKNPRLSRVELKNVVALAVSDEFAQIGSIEPLATLLWTYVPAMENITTKLDFSENRN